MELAIVGLGKMGMNMATRLVRGGHRVVGYARTAATGEEAISNGAEGAHSLEEAVSKLKSPRVVWVMVPAGQTTDDTIQKLSNLLSKGDIVIDGGNSNYKDSVRHAALLEPKGIEFMDCGTSGGIWGLSEGYSLMIGGKPDVVETMRPIFETLAPAADKGWGLVGPHGAGHFVKMIHNGIEYGMMEALAEGFSIMKAKDEFELDLAQVSHIWQHGSVVRSWLLDLTGIKHIARLKFPTFHHAAVQYVFDGRDRLIAIEYWKGPIKCQSAVDDLPRGMVAQVQMTLLEHQIDGRVESRAQLIVARFGRVVDDRDGR